MAASVHPTINDQLTKVQLRLLKQRLDKERQQADSFVNQGRHIQPIIEEKYDHLKEAAFQRKELLDRLKHEQQISRQLLRPRSNPVDDGAPRHRPSRRTESQPQLTGAELRRPAEMNYYPMRLQPIEHAPLPPPVLPPVPAYPVSTYQLMQPYQVLPPPQTVSQQQQPASNSRSDMYEMMMMQNAQMHQMIMQQLMLNSIQPRHHQNSTNNNNNSSNNNDRDRVLSLDLDDIRKLLKTSRESRRPPVYPDYRYNPPYAAVPPLVPTYHRPVEPIHVPAMMMPAHVQPSVNPETASHLKANYLRQQKELDDEVSA